MWRSSDADMSGPWEFAVKGGRVTDKSVWWGNGHAGHAMSCPDLFAPPQPTPAAGTKPLTVYTDIYNNYVLGRLDEWQNLEAIPPFSNTHALPLGSGSIMKSGGVGVSNANNPKSRRLYFGPMSVPGTGTLMTGPGVLRVAPGSSIHCPRGCNHTG